MKVHYGSAVSWSPARVVVDPNSFSRRDPKISVASFDDADRLPELNETVWATQPDDDGFEGVALGRVVDVNNDHRLLYIEVDWSSFHERELPDRVTQGQTGWVSVDHQRPAFGASKHLANGAYYKPPSLHEITADAHASLERKGFISAEPRVLEFTA